MCGALASDSAHFAALFRVFFHVLVVSGYHVLFVMPCMLSVLPPAASESGRKNTYVYANRPTSILAMKRKKQRAEDAAHQAELLKKEGFNSI